MKKFFNEFKDFISRGSVFDMAIGVIIGGAIGKMVASLNENILTPVLGLFLGGIDFSALAFTLGKGSVNYGMFIQSIFDFIITAFVIFLIIKAVNKARTIGNKADEDKRTPTEKTLEEIRDLLKEQSS